MQVRWFSTAPEPKGEALAWPIGWVRCAWCKKVARYGSTDVVLVKRRRHTVYMHAKCAHDAELAEWGKEPPMHGAD